MVGRKKLHRLEYMISIITKSLSYSILIEITIYIYIYKANISLLSMAFHSNYFLSGNWKVVTAPCLTLQRT